MFGAVLEVELWPAAVRETHGTGRTEAQRKVGLCMRSSWITALFRDTTKTLRTALAHAKPRMDYNVIY